MKHLVSFYFIGICLCYSFDQKSIVILIDAMDD